MTLSADARALSDEFCGLVCAADLSAMPQKTRRMAARVVLDAVGTMAGAAARSPEARPFVRLARADPGPCTVFGGGGSSPVMAAFANGALAHALDFEDVFERAPCHPNAAAVPAAIAMAQAVGGVSGADFLAAIVLGCETTCRLALSLTLCQATAPGEIKYSPGSHVRAVREAFGARAAVTSALLAADGVCGFDRPLEGEAGFFRLFADGRYDPAALTGGFGKNFLIDELSFKPWPSCRGTHAYIEVALTLKSAHGFHGRDMVRVDAAVGSVQEMLIAPSDTKRRPATAIDAKFSIPFTAALALTKGGVMLSDFDEKALADEEILAVAARVHPESRSGWDRSRASSGALRITLENGAVFERECHAPKGHPSNPMSEDELVEKFTQCCSASPKGAAAADFAREIADIQNCPDAGGLFASFASRLNGT